MNGGATSAFLQLISSAVTPVVMVSACATLILAANARHTDLASRLRALAAELRSGTAARERAAHICGEIRIFRRRFIFTWFALTLLYMAVVSFIATVLMIIVTQRGLLSGGKYTEPPFILGVCCMFASAISEIFDVSHAARSLDLDIQDVLHPTDRHASPASLPDD